MRERSPEKLPEGQEVYKRETAVCQAKLTVKAVVAIKPVDVVALRTAQDELAEARALAADARDALDAARPPEEPLPVHAWVGYSR